jgi:hypothetical protein
MRDGIYKNLPLARPYQAFLKSCTLDAERGEIAREKCERAVGAELREIRTQFKVAFRERAEVAGSLLEGFKTFGDEVTNRDLGGQNSPLENLILAHARRLETAGLKGAELESASYADALQEMMRAHLRQIEQTVLTSGSDSDSKATIEAARNAVNSAKIVPIVDSFLVGRSLNLPPARRRIDLDEDLSRSNP